MMSWFTILGLSSIAPQYWASDSRAQPRLTLKVVPGPAKVPAVPTRGSMTDTACAVMPAPAHFCPSRFLKQIRRSSESRSQFPCPNLGHVKRRLYGMALANNWPPGGGNIVQFSRKPLIGGRRALRFSPPPRAPPTTTVAPLPILYTNLWGRLLPMYSIPITSRSCSCSLSLR